MTEQSFLTPILFADLAGSTGLYERLGDTAAHAIVSDALARWSGIIARRGGRVVKTMGDGLFAVLPSPEEGVGAAEEFHRSLDEGGRGREVSLTGRVALHAGSVLEQDGDVFGDAVNVAARLVALAKPRQIVVSEDTVASLPEAARSALRPLGRTRVKGRASELEIHEWVWERAMVTVLATPRVISGTVAALILKAQGATSHVTAERPRITIGRQAFNDLVVDDARVSRLHARIELRGTRFVVCDESTNGTHLMAFGRESAVLHGEERDLGTMGFIGLGGPPRPGEPHTVEYQIDGALGSAAATAT